MEDNVQLLLKFGGGTMNVTKHVHDYFVSCPLRKIKDMN